MEKQWEVLMRKLKKENEDLRLENSRLKQELKKEKDARKLAGRKAKYQPDVEGKHCWELQQKKYSLRDIERETGINYRTVQRLIKAYLELPRQT